MLLAQLTYIHYNFNRYGPISTLLSFVFMSSHNQPASCDETAYYQRQMLPGNVFSRVCLSVYLSVCLSVIL